KPISLTRKEFLLLWLLASRAGEIVPRTAIASEVWGINFDSETIGWHIMNIFDHYRQRYEAAKDEEFTLQDFLTICRQDRSAYANA
ncbi:winged helix-turn-helix domain-containing protein, partial [Salmonella enterica subsp. enterica serovar Montevideo]|nr:winged helix-turn-helix domain-containing protein [Salmonella enterica subsp. enterica serovar Montevideo]